jgi:acyl-CoA synthetase (AMP-forming)/AMP-acid ligase II
VTESAPDPDYRPTIPGLLEHAVGCFADHDLVVLRDRRITYGEAEARSAEVARALLASGVGKGTRVGVLMPNGPDFVVAALAVTRIGALLVPINTFQPAPELAYVLRHADIHTLMAVPQFLSHDYVSRLEVCAPELRNAANTTLYLAELPYLRQIRIWGECDRPWAICDPEGVDAALADHPAIDDSFLRAVEDEVHPADWNVLIYTSGSTAAPKGVVQTHGSIVRHAAVLAGWQGYRSDDRIYAPLTFFWIGGWVFGLLAPMSVGATVLCEDKFDAGEVLELFERERVTFLTGWPHVGPALRSHTTFEHRDLSSLRGGYLKEVLPAGIEPMLYTLGMTETCSSHTAWPSDWSTLPEAVKQTLGRAAPGVEHCVCHPDTGEPLSPGQEGELWVRGYTVMQGLYKREREEVFTPDGWYQTGDGVTIDADGWLTFKGRTGDTIKTGGANVAPAEVEAVLNALPEIDEAHVVGLPDAMKGQLVAAAVVVSPGQSIDEDALRARLRESLSAFKVPKRVWFAAKSDMPYKATGKIDKQALLERMEQLLG